MGAAHWIVGAVVIGGGLFVLHNASAEEEHKGGAHKGGRHPKGGAPKGAPPQAAPGVAPGAPHATHVARVSPFPPGTHVEAQDQDGKWYGATIVKVDLADPDAVRWDAGTPGAARNPSTGTSSAAAVRASSATGRTPGGGLPGGPPWPNPTKAEIDEWNDAKASHGRALPDAALAMRPIADALATIGAANPAALPAALEGVQRGLAAKLGGSA